jgi:beta-N-acetylhexosaminidase
MATAHIDNESRSAGVVSAMFRQPRQVLLLLIILLCSACGPSGSGPAHPSSTAAITASPSATPAPSPTATPSCLDSVFAGLTMDQRIGQLFELGLAGDRLGATEISLIRNDHIGSVWFVERSTVGVTAIRAVTTAVQAQVSGPATGNIRFFIAANQEGGLIQAMQGPGFSQIPSAVVQGTLAPADLQKRALTWGQQLRAAGINFNYAPVMDVVPPGTDAQNQPIGALQREYGHDPATVGSHGAAFLGGMREAGVAVSLKHFPGLGRVTGNTDFTTATDTVTTTSDPYLQSFRQGIAANADFVMVALARYTRIDPNHLAAFSPTVITRMLRGTMGFGGVVISDDLGDTVPVTSIPPGTRAIDFLSAGGDMIISKTAAPADAMVAAVRSRAASDPAFRQRVNDAALRILSAKQAWGLLPC